MPILRLIFRRVLKLIEVITYSEVVREKQKTDSKGLLGCSVAQDESNAPAAG